MNNFPRPVRKATPPGPPPRPVQGPAVSQEAAWQRPWPRVDATFAALVGLIFTAFAMASGSSRYSSGLAHTTSVGVLLTLLASFAFEARGGLKNLVRPDLVGILALYYLTLYEFLFPQPVFDAEMNDMRATHLALWAVIIGFIGLFVGRHLVPSRRQPFEEIMTRPVHVGWLLGIFWVSFSLGYFYMLLAVDFDIPKMIEAMCRARFEQPWGRSKYGDWRSLLNEFALLLYLIPPIAGLMLARRGRYHWLQIVPVMLGFAWVIFHGFVGGTRTVFGAYLITFMIAFVFAAPAAKRREIIILCAACAAALTLSTRAMLEMRTIGFTRWWNEEQPGAARRNNAPVFVDGDLLAIARIAQFFPARNSGEYLGFEIPYLALVRPIPRAIWPGKPKGLSRTIEEAYGATQMTVAAAFVGEGYMSGGLFGVALEGLVLGLMAAWWNRLSSPRNSELGILVYASGFFAITITMRSTFAMTTALMPCVAGLLFGKYVLPKIRAKFKPRAVLPPRLRGKPGAPPPISE